MAYLQDFPRELEVVALGDVRVLSLGNVGDGISFQKLSAHELSTTVGSDSDIEGTDDERVLSPAISVKDAGSRDAKDIDINAWNVVCNRIFARFSELDDESVDLPA
eukprot:CAMPEP_0169124872 /NCGR_PEP_ID=MMETSP1015-20121227/34567_1 /TAXON_ID=342587 /ORGANISM="Karlodinium micrum, Strain CCMP2283" /LENGTH=105 /DNA_ID=CAMNT_0009188339 /DNA_START=86 /DNA_END=403 /DNA_ORIENTATION=-